MLTKRINKLVVQASKELNIPYKEALEMYRIYWMWVKNSIESMPLDNSDEEEFTKFKTSINIPNLGKFHTSYKRVQRIKESIRIINRHKNERDKHKER